MNSGNSGCPRNLGDAGKKGWIWSVNTVKEIILHFFHLHRLCVIPNIPVGSVVRGPPWKGDFIVISLAKPKFKLQPLIAT